MILKISVCSIFRYLVSSVSQSLHLFFVISFYFPFLLQSACDKSGFLYTRQSLWNQKKKKWDFKVIQNTCIWTALILPWKGVERKYTDDWAKKTMHTIKYNKKFSFGKIQHNIQWDKFTPLSATKGQLSYQHWKSEKKSPIYIISSVD